MSALLLVGVLFVCGSPLSSETTAFHTVVKLELGSSVNDASPWFSVGYNYPRRGETVHRVIYRCGHNDGSRDRPARQPA